MGNKQIGFKIYTLTDPTTNIIRYVGMTSQTLKRRLSKHIIDSNRKKTHKDCWIFGLRQKNLLPIIDVIDIVDENEWQFWEQHYISLFKSWNFNLVNLTIGGEGVIGNIPWNKGLKGCIQPNKTSIKKGQNLSPLTQIKKGQRLSPNTEFKKGQKSWNEGISWSDDMKKKMSNSKRGKKSKCRKLNDIQVIEIRNLKKFHTKKELAKLYCVNVFVIDKVLYSKKSYVL